MKLLTPMLLLLVLCLGCRHKGPPVYAGKSLRYWQSQAASENADKRSAAVEALGNIGPKGLPTLFALGVDTDRYVRAVANIALIRIGPTVVPELNELIHDPDNIIRAGAAKLLITVLVDKGGQGVPQLIELLKDPDPGVRADAAKAFARIGGQAPKAAIPAIREAAADENPGVRRAARFTLQVLVARKGGTYSPAAQPGRP